MHFYIIDVSLVLFLMLIVFKTSRAKTFHEDNFSIASTNPMRGVFAMWVVLHHIGTTVSFVEAGTLFSFCSGVIPVAAFFFLSGYAMMYKSLHSDNPLKGFFTKRIPKILIPLLVMYFVYIIYQKLSALHTGADGSLTHLIVRSFINMANGYPTVIHSWLAIELIVIYVLFFIAMKIFSNNKKLAVCVIFVFCGCLTIVAFALSYFREWPAVWYSSAMFFPLGSLYCYKKQQIDSAIRKRYKLFVSLAIIATFAAAFLQFVIDYLPFTSMLLLARNVFLGFMTVVLIVILSMKFRTTNKLWIFLGKISYEIYLTHGFVIMILTKIPYFVTAQQDLLFAISVILLTILLSYCVNLVDTQLLKLLKVTKK